MAESADICAHCGKQGAGFKRCSICKNAHYCGAACQKKDWKHHKKDCTAPVPAEDVIAKIKVAETAGDWRGVLKWEGRMEELMTQQPEKICLGILYVFCNAHKLACQDVTDVRHTNTFIALQKRRIPILEKLQRFDEKGTAMCDIAYMLINVARFKEAAIWSQRARDIGAEGGLFALECHACVGLATVAMNEGCHQDGLELYRNAVVAAKLHDMDTPMYELYATTALISALFKANLIEEVEPLVLRYREITKAALDVGGKIDIHDFHSLFFSACLHEVPCISSRVAPQRARHIAIDYDTQR